MSNPTEEVNDPDNPEWTAEKFARAIRFKDLPESLQRTLSKAKARPAEGTGEAAAADEAVARRR
jgi:hypothetical protein